MSDNTERPGEEGGPPNPHTNGEPETKPEGQQNKPAAGPSRPGPEPADDPREALLRGLKKYRLSPEEKAAILADMPPPEEHERMYRELMEQGGMSGEEFLASLGLTIEPHP